MSNDFSDKSWKNQRNLRETYASQLFEKMWVHGSRDPGRIIGEPGTIRGSNEENSKFITPANAIHHTNKRSSSHHVITHRDRKNPIALIQLYTLKVVRIISYHYSSSYPFIT